MQQQQRSAVLVDNPSKSLGTTAPPVPPKKEQKPSGNDFASDDFTCNAQNFDTARAGERVEQRSAATVQDEPRFGGGTEDAIAEPMDQSVRNDEFGRPMYDDFTGNWLFERFHEVGFSECQKFIRKWRCGRVFSLFGVLLAKVVTLNVALK